MSDIVSTLLELLSTAFKFGRVIETSMSFSATLCLAPHEISSPFARRFSSSIDFVALFTALRSMYVNGPSSSTYSTFFTVTSPKSVQAQPAGKPSTKPTSPNSP